ncbi:MAG: MFS transporter, partial [Alphaproteobacteria bacterium]|nr:MFS transporter [Alphaproteobacteria bacterium]
PILAPAFAGFLVENYGWRMVFVIASVTGFAVLIWTAMRFPETTREKVEIPNLFSVFQAYFNVLAERRFVFYTLVTTFVMTGFFSMMSGAPHLAEEAWGLSKEALGYYFAMGALGMMVTTFITARLAQKVDNNRLMLIGLGLSLTGPLVVSVLFLMGLDHPASFFVPMVLMGAGAGLVLPTATTGALAIIPRMAGTASGMMTFLQFAIAGIAAQAIGYFYHGTPWVIVAFMVGGIGLAFVSAITAIMAKPVASPSAGE